MRSRADLLFYASSAAFIALSVAAGARLLYPLDKSILRLSQLRTSPTLDAVGGLFSVLGDVEYAGPAMLALAAGLLISGRRALAWRLLVAFVATGAIELAMKFALPVPPVPAETARSFDAHPIVAVDYPYPYPSGHALRSTLLLGAVILLWPNRLLRVLALVLLAGMATTRIYLGVHWTSDVVGGTLLAVAALAWVFKNHSFRASDVRKT